MEFGDCTRIYKEHTHSVSAIIENQGLRKSYIFYYENIRKVLYEFFD